jgi:hypothetical protein
MRSVQITLLAVAVALGAVGCGGSRNEPAVIGDPTPEQIEAMKAQQARADQEEKEQEKLGTRNKAVDPNYFKVREEEMEHRRETQMAEKQRNKPTKK